MAWFKVDDKAHGHPKTVMAGNSAFGLWVRLGSYCSDHLTDGFVSKELVTAYGSAAEIKALLRVGYVTEAEGGYQLHDFLDYNPTREQVLAERARNAERQAKSRGNKDKSHGGSHGVTGTVTHLDGDTPSHNAPYPDPSPYPNVSTSQHNSSSSETPPAAAAAEVDSRTAEVIDLAVKVRQRQSQSEIRNPERWRQTVRQKITAEHAHAISAALEGMEDPDITGLVASITGAPRTEVASARMGGGYL